MTARMNRALDLVGQRFGRLVVLRRAKKTGSAPRWWCRCDCGKAKSVSQVDLRSGDTRSCGCLFVETLTKRNTKHGGRQTAEYRIWCHIKERCHNPSSRDHPDYGGRGISVCARWLNSFANFLADMGKRPSDMTIDRRDNDGNYEPGNCRWATLVEQANNKRSSVRLTSSDGRTMTVTEWSRSTGLGRSCISLRLQRGWSVDRSLGLVS